MSEDFDEDALYREGIELFNAGEWFEAHEVWEDVWHMAGGERKRFYQGLIQCAVTLEHVRRGNPRGVRSVFATAVTKFDGLPEVYRGLHVPRFLEMMRRVVAPVLALPSSYFEPGRAHGGALPANLDPPPRIELNG